MVKLNRWNNWQRLWKKWKKCLIVKGKCFGTSWSIEILHFSKRYLFKLSIIRRSWKTDSLFVLFKRHTFNLDEIQYNWHSSVNSASSNTWGLSIHHELNLPENFLSPQKWRKNKRLFKVFSFAVYTTLAVV